MWWFTTRKSGVNTVNLTVNLKELLGLGSYQKAWTWLQKLRRWTMRKDREKLAVRVVVSAFVMAAISRASLGVMRRTRLTLPPLLKDPIRKIGSVVFASM
jgi:hypothetical protein